MPAADLPQQDLSVLLQPLQLRHLTLRNRVVFGAHTANMSIDACRASAISAITASVPSAAPR
jgi:2,4-dienoyl-CoA reductase-like NADH-dependent reductase (Old Yellow Enzyme family)